MLIFKGVYLTIKIVQEVEPILQRHEKVITQTDQKCEANTKRAEKNLEEHQEILHDSCIIINN